MTSKKIGFFCWCNKISCRHFTCIFIWRPTCWTHLYILHKICKLVNIFPYLLKIWEVKFMYMWRFFCILLKSSPKESLQKNKKRAKINSFLFSSISLINELPLHKSLPYLHLFLLNIHALNQYHVDTHNWKYEYHSAFLISHLIRYHQWDNNQLYY